MIENKSFHFKLYFKIEITDTEYRINYDKTKGDTLKTFLNKILMEFYFKIN